jgi:hypothetical protein
MTQAVADGPGNEEESRHRRTVPVSSVLFYVFSVRHNRQLGDDVTVTVKVPATPAGLSTGVRVKG